MMDIVDEEDPSANAMGFGPNPSHKKYSVRNDDEIEHFKQNRESLMSVAQKESEAVQELD